MSHFPTFGLRSTQRVRPGPELRSGTIAKVQRSTTAYHRRLWLLGLPLAVIQLVVIFVISGHFMSRPPEPDPDTLAGRRQIYPDQTLPEDEQYREYARLAVQRVLTQIDLDLPMPEVAVSGVSEGAIAQYHGYTRRITFRWEDSRPAEEILLTAGHESGHYLIHMTGHFCPNWNTHPSCQLTEEAFVEVWAAHLVGSFWHPPGETSDDFVRRVVREFRDDCDPEKVRGSRAILARVEAHYGERRIPEDVFNDFLVHLPGVGMVDQMDALCRTYRDPERLLAEFQRQFMHPEETARKAPSTTTAAGG